MDDITKISLEINQQIQDAQRAARHAQEDSRNQAATTAAVLETSAYGVLILLFVLGIVLLLTPGCGGSPTGPSAPTPPPQPTCTIVHHPETVTSDLQVINGKLVLVYTTIPAYDETVCK